MLVYVTAGIDGSMALAFFSKTSVDRFCAAWAMFVRAELSKGVWLPSVLGCKGVDAPEFACVAITDASFLVFSEISCLTFLLRRCDGLQFGLRKGRGTWAMSRRLRSC